ncbi:MAG: Bug family tripartite tricarboxylate transporter substrate binding protein [Betaproteobacteria bacterium]
MKHSSTRRRIVGTLAASSALGAIAPARAQAWPDKPVRLIVPYPAGGGADSWSRIVSGRLEKVLGQPVILDYRPGASTMIGNEAGARATPDGYTFLLYDSTGFAYVPNLRKISYDPINAYVPLAHLGSIPFIFVAHPSVPARNMRELVAYAKANPGKLNHASAGIASPHHLIAELFKLRAGIQMNHVPYKGAVQYVADLLGGQVDLAVSTVGPALQHVQSGRLVALGGAMRQRVSALPELPSVAEQGFEGFDAKPWNCFVAPAGIPALARDTLSRALRSVLAEPEVVSALAKAGIEETGTLPPDRILDAMRADFNTWGEVIRSAHITMAG